MNAHILGATRVALALPVLILAACGGGSSSAPAQPAPDFTISVAQSAVTVGVGDISSPIGISVIGVNGFSAAVSVMITGLPPGATTSPAAPFSMHAGDTQNVTLFVPVNAAAGQPALSVVGTGGGLSRTSIVSLTIVPCLTGGNEKTIQDALSSAAGFADLCPGATFIVSGTINMGSYYATGTRIFTAGYPTDLSQKALVKVADHADAWPDGLGPNWFGYPMIAAQGNDLRIQNIRLDGNRINNTFRQYSALVRIHGFRNKVDGIYGTDPMGRPALEAAAPPDLCADLTVTRNFIGTSGSHIVKTSADPATWGDGIQIRCDRAYVAYNEIRDATDVGLISFGGKDSIYEFNHIENWASSAFGGLAADPEAASDANGHPLPTPMDFSGTIMRNNTVETCCGQHIHVALAVGVHLWCDTPSNTATCQYGTGLTYQDNQATGLFGYGLFLGGQNNAVVTGNIVTMTPLTWINCYVAGQNFYVLDHATGTFQDGYTTRTPLHWPCLGPTGSDEAGFYP
jgi:hypothetical protein